MGKFSAGIEATACGEFKPSEFNWEVVIDPITAVLLVDVKNLTIDAEPLVELTNPDKIFCAI